jgi:hypothetical protein
MMMIRVLASNTGCYRQQVLIDDDESLDYSHDTHDEGESIYD